MTTTRKILAILADGKPRTSKELMDSTGLSWKKVSNAIRALDRQKFTESEPVTYRITDAGLARSKWEPLTDPERLKRQYARVAARRAKKRAEQDAVKTIVGQAIAKRPALEACWSAR